MNPRPEDIAALGSPTGDIIWERLDPKTWRLRNRVPSTATSPPTTTTTTLPPNEQVHGMMDQPGVSTLDDVAPPLSMDPKDAHDAFRQLNRAFRRARHRQDPPGSYGTDEMVDRLIRDGAISVDPNGSWRTVTRIPGGRHGLQDLSDAIHRWRSQDAENRRVEDTLRELGQSFPKPRP